MSELSIIMPVYNERENISRVIAEIQDAVTSKIGDSTIIAVDDGSTDGTSLLLDQISALPDSRIEVFHKVNGGHGSAILYGLKKAQSKCIFLIDSDGQMDPRDFWKLWEKKDDYDLLTGRRIERHDPVHRLILTRIIKGFLGACLGANLLDANTPFKLFRNDLWNKLSPMIPDGTLTPSMFIAVAARKLGYKICEIPVTHRPRMGGETVLKPVKLFKFCSKAFPQLLSLSHKCSKT